MGCHFVVKRSTLSQRGTIWLQLLNKKTLSCPEYLIFRLPERQHPTHWADSCFPKHPKEFTLMAVGFTSTKGGHWPPGQPAGYYWAPVVPHSFPCAFILKTPGDGEQRWKDRFVILVSKSLKKFLVENKRQSYFKEFFKAFSLFFLMKNI